MRESGVPRVRPRRAMLELALARSKKREQHAKLSPPPQLLSHLCPRSQATMAAPVRPYIFFTYARPRSVRLGIGWVPPLQKAAQKDT